MSRTRTYVAGDWTGDENLIALLYHYNNSSYYKLSFTDAHDLMQANDTSLNCSIKKSLSQRMDHSKTFILIVGEKTSKLNAGSCFLCRKYSKIYGCMTGQSVSNKSYIEYECDKAKRDGLRIVVIYNSTIVQRKKCPEILRYTGEHVPGYYIGANNTRKFNYSKIFEVL